MLRQATQEPGQDVTRNGQGQGCSEEEGEVDDCLAAGGVEEGLWRTFIVSALALRR